jgi:hypothetical protein
MLGWFTSSRREAGEIPDSDLSRPSRHRRHAPRVIFRFADRL